MSDEWRVEVDLDDEQHGFALGERLRSLDLDDEARERLGDRVIVSRDGPKMFLYAGTEEQVREAERVARELVASEGLSAEVAVTRWHPDEEVWKDASAPLPGTEEEREAEYERHEAAEERSGAPDWEVKVVLPSFHETRELAGRLRNEGIELRHRWRYLLVPAPSERAANELAERIRSEAPTGAELTVEVAGAPPHPVFVFIGAHTPGIARDLER